MELSDQELENICDKIKNCLIIENNKNRIQIELSKTEFIITKLYEFDKFDISIDNSKTSLLDIINEHNWFILTFDKSEYRYFGGKLFKDTRLLKNIELFSKLWEEQNKSYTTQINSEKGYNHRLKRYDKKNNIYKNLPTNSTSFPKNSQFNYSKEKFINGMSELKNFASNSNNPNTSAIEANQILWILNSFVSICKQQNVQVHIVNTK